MSEILVIGHRNPDTDAICSAIGYADFKRRTGMDEAIAARCRRHQRARTLILVLRNLPPKPAPKFVADVSPKVADVMQRKILSVRPDSTAADALRLMDEKNLRILPVLDDSRKCHGLLSLFKLSKFLFPAVNRGKNSREILSSLTGLAGTLGGELVLGFRSDREEDLILLIGAMGLDSCAARLGQFPSEKLCVLVGDRLDIQNFAIQSSVRVLIITGGGAVDPEILETALRKRVSVIVSPHDTATTASLCRASVPVRHVFERGIFYVSANPPPSSPCAEEALSSELFRLPRFGCRGPDVGDFIQDRFFEDGDAQIDPGGS